VIQHFKQTESGEIINYFQTLGTNATKEGFNTKIRIIKSRARGFRNMIDRVCGGLSLPLQPIMECYPLQTANSQEGLSSKKVKIHRHNKGGD
jgi:hypothetical protein